MKKVLIMAIVLFSSITFAQKERTLSVNAETNLIDVVYYHDNGTVSQTGSYTKAGKLQGEWLSFSAEGKKTISGNYDNGKKVGKWFYFTNETVKEVDYNANVIAALKESGIEDQNDI